MLLKFRLPEDLREHRDVGRRWTDEDDRGEVSHAPLALRRGRE